MFEAFSTEFHRTEDFHTYPGYFETNNMILYAKAIQLKEKGKLSYSHMQIHNQIDSHFCGKWWHIDWEARTSVPISEFSNYMPYIVKDPAKYIYFQPELRELLQTLRAKGKGLFLATNSHYPYANLIMSQTLGEDWKSFFDVICEWCSKPKFFAEKRPFKVVDIKDSIFEGPECETLEQGKEYLFGNHQILEQFFKTKLASPTLKFLFFGDSLMSDCGASAKLPNWEALAIIEELQDAAPDLPASHKDYMIKSQSFWGNYFFELTESGPVPTLWMDYARHRCRYALPFMAWIKHLM